MRSLVTVLAAAAALCFGASAAAAGTLDQVKARGELICGANPGLAGFGLPDDQGVYKGLDVDECRAIAAAIFNDPSKVKYLPINAKDRPTILASGQIDVLDPQHHLDDVARDRRHVLHRRQLLRRPGLHGAQEARRRFGAEARRRFGLRAAGHDDRTQPRRLSSAPTT